MSNKKLQDHQLDQAIKGLLRAAAPSDAEIDRIAESPHLYSAIRRQIGSGERPAHRRPLINFAYASLALTALIAAFGLYAVSGGKTAQLPADNAVARTAAHSPDVESGKLVPDLSPQPIKVSAGDAAGKRTRPTRRSTKKVRRPPDKKLTTTERPQLPETFFALDYTGERVEDLSGGRVVRMDVPRTSLFAMGVNVPLENESASVKADVMVGPDGVARAIRLVE